MNLHAASDKQPTILDAHSLPPAWQRRFYELIAERNVALQASALAVVLGCQELLRRSDAEIAAIDAAMRRILDAHAKGLLRRWATATPEGLLCASSGF